MGSASCFLTVCVCFHTFLWLNKGLEEWRDRALAWKMEYIMHVSGRLWECSATLKIFMPHLLIFSRSYCRGQNLSVRKTNYFLSTFWLHYLFITHLWQQFFLICLDPEAIGSASRNAGRVADLPHPTDLSHHPTLLLLLALSPLSVPGLGNWTWKLQLILLVWNVKEKRLKR